MKQTLLSALILLAVPSADAGSGYAVSADGVVDTRYELTSLTPISGSISGIAVDGKYLTGTRATLTAVPAAGYAFTGWTGATSGTANPLSLLMNSDKTIVANFTLQYSLTVSALNNGSISGIAAGGKYLTGTTAALTAVPAAGYAFTGWTGDASGIANPLSLLMDADRIIGATFTQQYTLTASAVSNGTIGGIVAGGKYLTGATATLTAVPAAGYAFTGWTGAASGVSNPLSLLMDADKTIVANFTRQYTLTVSALNNGSISGLAVDGKYLTGTTATLTAVPAAGYVFTGWTGDASGIANPLSLLMDADKTIAASYTPDTNDDDGDGLTNYQEIVEYGTDPTKPDTDGDEAKDGADAFPLDPTETLDTDRDGTGDNADTDDDGDGYSDEDEINTHHTNPKRADSDGDGLTDPQEIETHHTDPNISDTDNDGLRDGEEFATYHTNPLVGDTDGDGFLDGYEVLTGKLPLDPLDKPALVAEARTAIEFTFPAAIGTTYRIEASTDLATWEIVESGIAGNGSQIQRFYSTRNQSKRYFRVELVNP